MAGSKFGRLFSGKHGKKYDELKIGQHKDAGAEIGAYFSCSKTNPEKDEKITFIGKFVANPVGEKIYMDIVRYFANGPATRIIPVNETIVKDYVKNDRQYAGIFSEREFQYNWDIGLKDRFPKVNENEYLLIYLS